VKYQMGQGMAKGGEGGGPGAAAAQMAVGFGMAQEMMKQSGMSGQPAPSMAPQTTSPSGGLSSGGAAPQAADLMGVPEVAKYLGVSEADVVASITAGDLKAKKIGAAFRITKAAVDQFLAS
jgi:excisionase family DNA binding protein